MVTMLLIRHGEAEGNLEHRLIGQMDVSLSPTGRNQSLRLADALGDHRIDRIVSSDLSRAVDTLAPLADRLGLGIETDRRLREVDNGAWGGLLPDQVEERWPDLWERYRGGEDVVRPQGESWAEVAVRVLKALEDIATTSLDHAVVAVGTHGGPILTTLHLAHGNRALGNVFAGPIDAVPNASITTIQMPPLEVVGIPGDVAHLRR